MLMAPPTIPTQTFSREGAVIASLAPRAKPTEARRAPPSLGVSVSVSVSLSLSLSLAIYVYIYIYIICYTYILYVVESEGLGIFGSIWYVESAGIDSNPWVL